MTELKRLFFQFVMLKAEGMDTEAAIFEKKIADRSNYGEPLLVPIYDSERMDRLYLNSSTANPHAWEYIISVSIPGFPDETSPNIIPVLTDEEDEKDLGLQEETYMRCNKNDLIELLKESNKISKNKDSFCHGILFNPTDDCCRYYYPLKIDE